MKHIELAKKIKALADRGVGGEKENAETMLNALLKKHGMTIDEIDGYKKQDYFFQVEPQFTKLLYQIAKLTDESIVFYLFPNDVMKENNLAGNCCIASTAAQYLEIDAKFNFYLNLYKEELDLFYHAFLNANDLLKMCTDESDLTKEELLKHMRSSELATKIKKGQFMRQLTNQ